MSVPWLKPNNSAHTLIGFRPNHSTNSALIEITEQIRKACDKGLDFKKAFDTVNHNILLTKLQHYGIKENANNWLCLFLMDRKQYTSVTGKDSNSQEITHGVCTRASAVYYIYQRFKSISNLK